MQLKSLLLCADEKIARVLRRTLGDLEIGIELCTSPEAALRQLTRERFEAIIVDCAGPGAAQVLRGAQTAPCNKRAIAVAILDPSIGLRSGFDIGAHFILYKPVSVERAKSSFRAARALMKRERRRNSRIAVNFQINMVSIESGARLKANTTDIGEGGLAISLPRRTKPQGRWSLSFTLPGAGSCLELNAEFAWQGSGSQVGLRFVDPSPEATQKLREWLSRNTPDAEMDDPPVRCQLTDLSLRACYLEISSPFPVSTRVSLLMKAAGIEVRSEGVIRVMHPDQGMGVEFTKRSAAERASLEKFLTALAQNPNMLPELLVQPEGLETDAAAWQDTLESVATDDPLLDLFRTQTTLGADLFHARLQKQRGLAAHAGASA
jgi:hypothetical protein